MASRIPYPTSGCRRISAHSALVSGPGLSRMLSGTPILPMSCRSAPRAMSSIRSSATPMRWAMATV